MLHKFTSPDAGPSSAIWPACAVVFTVLAQKCSQADAELPSEVLCWLILPLVFHKAQSRASNGVKGSNGTGSQVPSKSIAASSAPSFLLTAVAVGVALAAFAAAEFRSQALVPALTPLVILAQRQFHNDARPPRFRDCSSLLNSLTDSPLIAFAFALFCIFTISQGDMLAITTSVPSLSALLGVYLTLSLRGSTKLHNANGFDIERVIVSLSLRTAIVSFALLLLRSVFLQSAWPRLSLVLALGLVKSCMWHSLIIAAQNSQWLMAPVIKVCGVVATADFMALTSEHQALSYVLATLVTVAQINNLLPQGTNSRHWIWLLSFVALVPYVWALWNFTALQSVAPKWDSVQLHPLEKLIEDAQQTFNEMRKRQSVTYSIAHENYRRRYGIDPPPGFEAWFEYAVSHESPIIDEYDTLFESIRPYLQLSGKQVKKLMRDIQERPTNELWICSFEGEDPEAACHHRKRSSNKDRDISLLLNELLGPVASQVKDIQVMFNHLDEPRVLFPPTAMADGHFEMRNIKRASTWADVTAHCPSGREDWNAKHPLVEQYGLPFVTNRSSVMDLCQHAEYENMHGLLISPKNLRLIEGHVPILGTGSFSTMGDILIPSPAYIQAPFQYEDNGDVPWEKKRNNLYWDGSNTGGWAKEGDSWLDFHRQRFVSFAQRLEGQTYYYLQSVGGKIIPAASKLLNGRQYDVAFTRFTQCAPSACHEERNFFRVRSRTSPTEALKSRLVFDLDGNGISGRFYRLLASHSLPLKQTLLREWHDERLVPWLHYVPISQNMKELPEVVRWLTSTERGQMRARQLAEAGRRWYYEAIRDVDKGVYLYRVMLELRRMQDEKRAAGES